MNGQSRMTRHLSKTEQCKQEKSKVGNTKWGAEEHFKKKISMFSQIRDVAFYETVTEFL